MLKMTKNQSKSKKQKNKRQKASLIRRKKIFFSNFNLAAETIGKGE